MSIWAPAPPPAKLSRYRIISPNAGVRVSPLQLGAMSIGEKWSDMMGSMDKETSFNCSTPITRPAAFLSILLTSSRSSNLTFVPTLLTDAFIDKTNSPRSGWANGQRNVEFAINYSL